MSENKQVLERNSGEKLGEFLRRARQAAGIEQAELAREIRITVEVLDHLENGRYDKLPVSAYVRGYLNTICNRLALDRTKILDWYMQEAGRDSLSIDRELGLVPELKNVDSSSSSRMVWILVFLFLGLFLVVLKTRTAPEGPVEFVDSSAISPESVEDSLGVDDTVGLTADSVLPQQQTQDTAKVSADSVVKPVETILKFECVRDSTWLRVRKKDGLSIDRLLRSTDKPRYVSHTDTMTVIVGSPEKTRMFINDVRVPIPNGSFRVYNGEIIKKENER